MSLPSTGPISLSQLQTEFGGSNPIGLSEYYRGGSYVTDNNTSVPSSGAIDMSDFLGAQQAVQVTYELIGGGGEGGGGYFGGTGNAGTSSYISGSGFTTITSTGGSGGIAQGYYTGQNGASSYYGAGGSGGINSDSDRQTPGYAAPSTSYGAGGGGGGSNPFAAYNGGGGGGAATRLAGTMLIAPQSLTVRVGTKGSGIYGGGDGANGYVKITVGGISTEYKTPGTYTYVVSA